jgi:hypothetical protein
MITLAIEELRTNGNSPRLQKVYYSYYDFESGLPHPLIRLKGKYLESYGFKVGDRIEVQLDVGRITIHKAHQTSQEKKPS